MRRLIIVSFFLLCCVDFSKAFAIAPSLKPVSAAIVLDADTGQVWESYRADTLTYPASLTKMMTLYLLFEALEAKKIKLTTKMPVSKLAAAQAPCKLGLKAGQKLTVLDCIMGMITKSANDASVVIAEHLGGSVEAFAKKMNGKARALKMEKTIFKNPNGLPNKLQRTTARDMAKLAQALYKRFPNYYRYFRTKSFIYKGQIYKNHNKLLGVCPGVDGIKTGYIAASGFNLAASAKRHDTRLITVVMGGETSRECNIEVSDLLNRNFLLALADKNDRLKTRQRKAEQVIKQISPPRKGDTLTVQTAPESLDAGYSSAQRHNIHTLFTSYADDSLFQSLDEKTDWQIQMGAYQGERQAVITAQNAQERFNIPVGQPAVIPVRKKQKRYFQARLVDLTRFQAQEVCRNIKAQGHPCLVLKMEKKRPQYAMAP